MALQLTPMEEAEVGRGGSDGSQQGIGLAEIPNTLL